MKTGNTCSYEASVDATLAASMEPGHEDREYGGGRGFEVAAVLPQWSPVMKTGNTLKRNGTEYGPEWPQWSPVMKTGNTDASRR